MSIAVRCLRWKGMSGPVSAGHAVFCSGSIFRRRNASAGASDLDPDQADLLPCRASRRSSRNGPGPLALRFRHLPAGMASRSSKLDAGGIVVMKFMPACLPALGLCLVVPRAGPPGPEQRMARRFGERPRPLAPAVAIHPGYRDLEIVVERRRRRRLPRQAIPAHPQRGSAEPPDGCCSARTAVTPPLPGLSYHRRHVRALGGLDRRLTDRRRSLHSARQPPRGRRETGAVDDRALPGPWLRRPARACHHATERRSRRRSARW